MFCAIIPLLFIIDVPRNDVAIFGEPLRWPAVAEWTQVYQRMLKLGHARRESYLTLLQEAESAIN